MLKMIRNPTVQIPLFDQLSPPSYDSSDESDLADPPTDVYSCDDFRMYEFKVRRCARGRAHDWTDCPYAHPAEKARRRDPRRFHYSGTPCPDFKKGGGSCEKGDSCEFAHGVFECWLHPSRYRTQPCKDGTACRRRVCFFAHTPEQLRVVTPKSKVVVGPPVDSYDGSPLRMKNNNNNMVVMATSPTSVLSEFEIEFGSSSPPLSPDGLVMMMRKMSLCGGGGRFGYRSSPSTPKARRDLEFEGGGGEEESFDGLDVGWVSELVK